MTEQPLQPIDETPVEEDEAVYEPPRPVEWLHERVRNAPWWIISLMIHIGILLLLVRIPFTQKPPKPRAREVTVVLEALDETEIQEEEDIQVHAATTNVETPDTVPVELTRDLEQVTEQEVPQPLSSRMGQAGQEGQPDLFVAGLGSGGGTGNGDGGGLRVGSTKFMGTQSSGKRFAFIIDYSASMSTNQMNVTQRELISALRKLPSGIQVAVMFFSGPCWMAGEDPQAIRKYWGGNNGSGWFIKDKEHVPTPRWVRLTPGTLRKLEADILETRKTFGTDWGPPFERILSMTPRPDVIFFMTDGAVNRKLSDATVATVRKHRRTKVNTVAFGIRNDKAKEPLEEMAKLTHGTFKAYTAQEINEMAGAGKKEPAPKPAKQPKAPKAPRKKPKGKARKL